MSVSKKHRKGIKVFTKSPNDIWQIEDGIGWVENDYSIEVLTVIGEPIALFNKEDVVAIGYAEELK